MEPTRYKISEIFYSPQGEGRYTGQLTAWVRTFSCNLQCDGFGQKDPTDPSTFILPYKDFDVSTVSRIEDLPVFDYGCDSSYSWSAKFKNLCPSMTSAEIAGNLLNQLPGKSFWQNQANNYIHLAFTGGEPLMPKGQKMIVDVIETLKRNGEFPERVTVETNGTQVIGEELDFLVENYYSGLYEFFASVSPKLFHVSGEPADRAMNIDAIKSIGRTFRTGQLKFVVSNDDKAWKEMEQVIKLYRTHGVHYPVYVMPVGATAEQQGTDHIKQIAYRALDNGYNIAARVHTYLFGNVIGS